MGEKSLRNEHQAKWSIHNYLSAAYNDNGYLIILTKTMGEIKNLHKIFMTVIYISSFQSLFYDYILRIP